MAPDTSGGRALELIVDVTSCAVETCMRSGQSVARVLQVIEANAKPVVEAMALLAGCRKAGGDVGRPCGRLKILGVAGIAGG